jgi:hypothetical protein
MLFNPLDLDKWRGLIADFDKKRVEFFNRLNALKNDRGATPELEAMRRNLINQAGPVESKIAGFMETANKVRDWIRNFTPNLGATDNHLGFAPILIGVGIGGAALIVKSITDWLTKTNPYFAAQSAAKEVRKAGGSATQVQEAAASIVDKTSSAKFFGFDVRWLLAIGAMFVVAPFVIKEVQKRR